MRNYTSKMITYCLLFFVIAFSHSENINYCRVRKSHPFCGNNCLTLPRLYGKDFQVSITKADINEMSSSLNTLRSMVMKRALVYYFADMAKRFLTPVKMNEVVSYIQTENLSLNIYTNSLFIFQRWDDTLACLSQAFANRYNFTSSSIKESLIVDQDEIGIGNLNRINNYSHDSSLS